MNLPEQIPPSPTIGSVDDYLLAGCDLESAFLNAEVARRFPPLVSVYAKGFGRLPNFAAPRAYSEKIQWRIAFDRNPVFVTYCDKLAAREFARQRSSRVRLPELYWVGDEPEAMPLAAIEPPFVVKPNNRSGEIILVRSREELDPARLVQAAREWLGMAPYGAVFGEWSYALAKPAIMVEQLLFGSRDMSSAPDFRIDVFGGRTQQIFFRDAAGDRRGMFSADWRPLELDRWKRGRLEPFVCDQPAPKNLDRMVAAAEEIAGDIDYVRVDLYNIDGEIFFGELTPFPYTGFATWVHKGADCRPFAPRDYDDELGAMWTLPAISN